MVRQKIGRTLLGKRGAPQGTSARRHGRRRISLWKKLTFALLTTALFFVALELVLMLAGLQPVIATSDPYVGFVSTSPVFREVEEDGRVVMRTAPNKLTFFNDQAFPKVKPPGTYRIVTVGGSTTYGRPYNDATSFSGWLRGLLPVADPSRRWEVINAGGISYASYRVAVVMEDLAQHDPDLFIVYCGHNEFLEDRTYGDLRDASAGTKWLAGALAHTRIFALLDRLLKAPVGQAGQDQAKGRDMLPEEVTTLLDNSIGPQEYHRDEPQREKVLAHYRLALERLVKIAHQAGAEILFVVPASNLKDCTPFKSQNTEGVDADEWRAATQRILQAKKEQDAEALFAALEEAARIDDRYAMLHYERGQALLQLERLDEARQALQRAREEDVCSLRALEPMVEIVRDVASRAEVPLVDLPNLLRETCRSEHGHDLLGKEYFLDHVHPTITTHRRLARWIIEAMDAEGWLRLSAGWNEDAIAAVVDEIEAGIDPQVHATALMNLSQVLSWAGKFEDARRPAFQALELLPDDPACLVQVGHFFEHDGDYAEALSYFWKALRRESLNGQLHHHVGRAHFKAGRLEAAAAHCLMATKLRPDLAAPHYLLGKTLLDRGEAAAAVPQFRKCLSIQPKNALARKWLGKALQELKAEQVVEWPLLPLSANKYEGPQDQDADRPRLKIVCQLKGARGQRPIFHGIWTSWYPSGMLQEFRESRDGEPCGVRVTWAEDGTQQTRETIERGPPVGGHP